MAHRYQPKAAAAPTPRTQRIHRALRFPRDLASANRLRSFLLLGWLALASSVCAEASDRISFNRDVRPILSDKCFACHGFDSKERKADLRLDTPDGASEAIVAGKPDESELWFRITEDDADEIMPPPETGKSLDQRERDILRRWILEGAEFEPHWAYVAPKRPAGAPEGSAAIDFFVDRQLDRLGMHRSPEADRITQIRRLSFDLTGLPPTPAEVADFVGDTDPDAYPRLVERLLASPHFGERMAIGWLDLVRYADTVGFHGDQPVSVSPYRDYVIRAFNENLPFDRFTREQIAGDLLPGSGPREKIASGYNRLNMTTEEGGSQAREYLVKYAGDRVRTTATAWLGATMGCAECHDHKFDPYTMQDFYSFAAFFADIEEVGVYGNRGRPPEMIVLSPEQELEIAGMEAELAQARQDLESAASARSDDRLAWEEAIRGDLNAGTPNDLVWLDDEPPPGAQLSPNWNRVSKDKEPVHSGSQARVQSADGMIQHYFKDAADPLYIDEGDAFFVHVWLDPANPPKSIMLQVHSNSAGTWEHRAFWGDDLITYGGVGTNSPAHRPAGPLPEAGRWVRLEIPASDIGFSPGQAIDGFSFDQFGGRVLWDSAGIRSQAVPALLKRLAPDARAVFAKSAKERSDDENERIDLLYLSHSSVLQPLHAKVRGLEDRIAEARNRGTSTLITVAVPPRETRVLHRGDWMDDSGPVVQPQIPAFLGQIGDTAEGRLDRLDLANWLVSRDNPLTARVFVNRLWKQFFGRGISKVLDDLGSQGEWPSHPDLLDWLAVEFMESGWDVKHIVRVIVGSGTYRQSSDTNTDFAAIDPVNRRLWRQARLRLPAELIRDNALAVSGLLVRDIGGTSAKPYQPAGYYRHLNFPRREYEPDKDQHQWRRGIYTHWQRTFLHPMLMAFDAPSRDECAADRPASNTPTQALVLLNDPTFVEAARVFGARILREGGGTDRDRLAFAFSAALSRSARPSEMDSLLVLASAEREEFTANPSAAAELVGVGLAPVPPELDKVELATWTSVSRVILNLHEFVVRP